MKKPRYECSRTGGCWAPPLPSAQSLTRIREEIQGGGDEEGSKAKNASPSRQISLKLECDHSNMTVVTRGSMGGTVSKSKLKAQALKYFREVEKTGRELIITDRGKPVLKLVPYKEDLEELLRPLRGTVLRYDDPFEPVAEDDWEALK